MEFNCNSFVHIVQYRNSILWANRELCSYFYQGSLGDHSQKLPIISVAVVKSSIDFFNSSNYCENLDNTNMPTKGVNEYSSYSNAQPK